MRKEIIIILSLLLLVAACDGNGNNSGGGPIFIGGSQGITPQFTENAPPAEVFDSGTYPFDVEVQLINRGEFDVAGNQVKVQLSGINPVDFGRTLADFTKSGLQEDVLATKLDSEGNRIEAPPTYVRFNDLMFSKTLPGNNQFPIRADVCYAYRTEAFADACIRADVLSNDPDAVCQISDAKTIVNSGSPIHITSFSQQPSGSDKVRYVFQIEHVGAGRFFYPEPNVASKCPTDVQTSRQMENRVFMKVESTLQNDLQCSGFREGSGLQGTVYLVNGRATVHCTQVTPSSIDFIDKVFLTMEYDYKEDVDTNVLVKKTVI